VFEGFYREYCGRLVAYLVGQGASAAVAADIVQDTMIKVFERWHSVRAPKAWAYKTAYQAFLRYATSPEEPAAAVPEPSMLLPCPDEAEEYAQHNEAVRFLRGLPARQRQVLALTYDGWTPKEIAEMLGINSLTVRSNLRKARCAAVRDLKLSEEG
jgi:RNA polymerase sigma-70 factor (ECF subfamily)